MQDNLYALATVRLMAPARKPWLTIRKVGGLLHWRIGRLGGSFYLAKR